MPDFIFEQIRDELENRGGEPIVIVSQDKELEFLNKRRIEMLEEFHEKKEKMIEEFEEKLNNERLKAWSQIEKYCEDKYGIPKKSSISISNGVLFWCKGDEK